MITDYADSKTKGLFLPCRIVSGFWHKMHVVDFCKSLLEDSSSRLINRIHTLQNNLRKSMECACYTHTHADICTHTSLNGNEWKWISRVCLLLCCSWIMMPHPSPMAAKVPSEGVDTVIQKSSRSSSHQSSRHRTRDKSRERDKDREQAKDWPPEKLSDSHSPVSFPSD